MACSVYVPQHYSIFLEDIQKMTSQLREEDNSISPDVLIPDHILEQYFRLKNQADEYLNNYIRHYRANQIILHNEELTRHNNTARDE